MERFKFDIYQKEKGYPLLDIISLKSIERQNMKKNIYTALGMEYEAGNLFMVLKQNLQSRSFKNEESFNADLIFKNFKINISGNAYLFWSDNDIDLLPLTTLYENWEYIWYGKGDDALILFIVESARLLMITHYGEVFYN